jgi:NitT/TauT family transport system permease protein
MVSSLYQILLSGRYQPDIVTTLGNVLVSIVSSMIAGLIVATLLQSMPVLRKIFDPLFATYYSVPIYAFYPLMIVLFGLGDMPQIAIGFLLAVMAVIINTLNGLDRVPPVLMKVARMHRMSYANIALKVRLPSAMPYIFTGFKLAVAYSFVGVIGAEFITASRGIGYQISFSYNNFDNRVMYPLILLVLLIVTAVNISLYIWERHLLARRRA